MAVATVTKAVRSNEGKKLYMVNILFHVKKFLGFCSNLQWTRRKERKPLKANQRRDPGDI